MSEPVIHHPVARLQGGVLRGACAAARGLSHRQRGARVHRLRNRRLRVGRDEPPLARLEGARRSYGNFGMRWQTMAAAFGCDVVPLIYDWAETSRRRLPRAGRERAVSRCSELGDVDRVVSISAPRRRRTTPARSSSTPISSLGAVPSKPTAGGSTSSSPARRRPDDTAWPRVRVRLERAWARWSGGAATLLLGLGRARRTRRRAAPRSRPRPRRWWR